MNLSGGMASTAAIVSFLRLGMMSLKALLTGFLVCAGAACAGAVCAGAVCAGVVCAGVVCAGAFCAVVVWPIADAASNNKPGITRVFIFLFSLCGRKHSACGRVRATELRHNLQAVHNRRTALGLDGRGARPYTGKTFPTGRLALS